MSREGKPWTDVEIAARWDADIRTVQKMLREKRLRGFHAGRAWRVTQEALDEFEANDNTSKVAS